MVIYDYKAIDYINFILRAGDIAECPPEKVRDMLILFSHNAKYVNARMSLRVFCFLLETFLNQ